VNREISENSPTIETIILEPNPQKIIPQDYL